MITIYQLWQNADTIEGRGPMRLVGSFKKHDVASAIAKRLPTDMGGGPLYDIRPEPVYETEQEYNDAANHALVASAFERLSQAEIDALRKHFRRDV